MKRKNSAIVKLSFSYLLPAVVAVSLGWLPALFVAPAVAQTPDSAQPAVAKRLGAIKAINGTAVTLAPDAGPEITANIQPNARILRMAPGDKDLKNAAPIQLQELQVGDTIRVRGYASDDAKSINTLEVIVITHSAVDAVRDQIRLDWQKRGMGGLVKAVDPAASTVTISSGASKTVAVKVAKNTVVRRYAPDSVKFEDAKPSTLAQINAGDQLRVRGTRSADGTELTADEIVAGAFPFIEGTIKVVDASAGTLSVQDMVSKKTILVKVTADSQLHKIPAEMAQHFAARLKSAMPPGTPGAGGGGAAAPAAGDAGGTGAPAGDAKPAGGTPGSGSGNWGGGGAGRSGGAPDFQQILSHLPASTLTDLHLQKGDAVIILSTEGTPTTGGTAITLLSGVEPILQAAPNAGQAMMLAPWSLGGAPGGDQ